MSAVAYLSCRIERDTLKSSRKSILVLFIARVPFQSKESGDALIFDCFAVERRLTKLSEIVFDIARKEIGLITPCFRSSRPNRGK